MHPLWILIPSVVVVAAFATLWQRRRENARTEALLHFARMNGFEFLRRPRDLPFRTRLLARRRGKATRMLTRSDPGSETILFDYRYLEGSGETRSAKHQTVLALRKEGRSLPRFELRPENLLHKIADAFGWHDIDFEHRPEFSGEYLLRSEDERAVRGLFGSSVLAHFERHLGWSVEASDGWVIVYRAGKRVRPERLTEFLEDARGIEELLDLAVRDARR